MKGKPLGRASTGSLLPMFAIHETKTSQSDSVQSDRQVLKGIDYSTHHQALNAQNDKCRAAKKTTVPGHLRMAWQTTIGTPKEINRFSALPMSVCVILRGDV